MTRPRGRPPMPSAMSRAMEPVGMTLMAWAGLSPSRMTEPLPNCLSIWDRAMSRALSRSSVAMVLTFGRSGEVVGIDARSGVRHFRDAGRSVENGAACGRHTRPNVCSIARATRRRIATSWSALLRGHVVVLADRQPHPAHRQPGVDRLHRGAASERPEDVVARDALGAHRPELGVHPAPELLQSHDPTLTRARPGRCGPRSAPRRAPYPRCMLPGTGNTTIDVVLQGAIIAAMIVGIVLLIRNYRGR